MRQLEKRVQRIESQTPNGTRLPYRAIIDGDKPIKVTHPNEDNIQFQNEDDLQEWMDSLNDDFQTFKIIIRRITDTDSSGHRHAASLYE